MGTFYIGCKVKNHIQRDKNFKVDKLVASNPVNAANAQIVE